MRIPTSEPARYWSPGPSGSVDCSLCPRRCRIGPGMYGHCGVRFNNVAGDSGTAGDAISGGFMTLPFYGRISSLAMDPIEKKPLKRFMPGTSTFSAGFWGCNMDCPFCQNHEISHPGSMRGDPQYPAPLSPGDFVAAALDSGAPSISYTYSEPCIHAEYITACMERARDAKLKNVLVTNGCILPEAARDILALTDATNVDLKCHSEELYRSVLKGELDVVKNFIQIAATFAHVEVTTLMAPGLSDSPEAIASIADFLASISDEIPLHLTRYHPDFRMNADPPSRRAMERAAAPAFDVLRYVYLYAPMD